MAVATRDWLRAGIGLDLMGTTLEADVPGAAEGLKVCAGACTACCIGC